MLTFSILWLACSMAIEFCGRFDPSTAVVAVDVTAAVASTVGAVTSATAAAAAATAAAAAATAASVASAPAAR